jgi:hypothetical protein
VNDVLNSDTFGRASGALRRYGRGSNGRRGGMVTVWVTVLVSVLGETVTVLGGTVVVPVSVGETVVVPVSVLDAGGAVSVTV